MRRSRHDDALRLHEALGRVHLDPAKTPEIRALSDSLGDAQWLELSRRADRLKTAPWGWHHASALALDVPRESRDVLQAASRDLGRKTIASDVLLRTLNPLLVGEAPDAMLIKGAVVEARAYPEGLMRPQVDIDIVARPGRMRAIVAWLRAQGFTDAWTTRSGHEVGLADPSGPSVVEVHRTIVCPYRFAPFTRPQVSRALFSDGQRDGHGRLVPADVEHTAFLLLHLVELIYADQRHVADAAAWMRAVPVDPQAVAAVAHRWQASRAVAAGVAAVERFDPGALGPGWRCLVADAPDDTQHLVAELLRKRVRSLRHGRIRQHPRWLEGAGLAAHLDAPWWFLASYARRPRLDPKVG